MKSTLRGAAASVAMAAGAAAPAHALTLETSNDAFGLANTLFLGLGATAIDAELTTAALVADTTDFQTAVFNNVAGTYGLPNRGIVLSTGNVNDFASVTPPGATGDTGFVTEVGSDIPATAAQQALLGPITGVGSHFDVAQLDITFVPDVTSNGVLTFFASFGSMEFPDFVGSSFTDGFGLYVNDVNVAGVTPTGGGATLPVNIDHPDMRFVGGTLLTGVLAPNGNPVLRFDVPVNVNVPNTFTVIIGDASDSALDTTVFLSSFFTGVGGDGGGTPSAGGSEFDPILPSNPPDPETGQFVIPIPEGIPPGEINWFDPPVSVGFEYEVEGNAFAGLQAPSLATVVDLDGYIITVGDETFTLLPGASMDFFDVFGLNPTVFTLTGIDPALALDPEDAEAFPLGISYVFATQAGQNLLMTPITVDVNGGGNGGGGTVIPLPATALLYGLGLAAVGAVGARRRRRAA